METKDIAELMERVLTGDPWHGPSVQRILEGLSHEQASRRPLAGVHSVWELVLHMTGWTHEVTARLGGRAAQEPEAGDWPEVGEPTPQKWQAATAALFAAHRDLARAIRQVDAEALDRPVLDFRESALGTGLSHYLTLHGVIHHTVYHSGQMAMVKRALGG